MPLILYRLGEILGHCGLRYVWKELCMWLVGCAGDNENGDIRVYNMSAQFLWHEEVCILEIYFVRREQYMAGIKMWPAGLYTRN